MSGEMSLSQERRITWNTERPYTNLSRRSTVFGFQGYRWFFELSYKCYVRESYHLRILNVDEDTKPKSFDLSSFIEAHDEAICFYRKTVRSGEIRTIDLADIPKGLASFSSCRSLNWVFIFHGYVSQTLQLDTERLKGMVSCCNIHRCLESLSEDMGKLLNEGSNHDVELKCGDLTVKAHRNVLSTRSGVFQAMLHSDMVEGRTGVVEIKDIEADILKDFVEYLYTGKLPDLPPKKAMSVYEAADKYMLDALVEYCASSLMKSISIENAFEILTMADVHSDERLKDDAIAFIIDKKIPMMDDQWIPFSQSQSKLAMEVLSFRSRNIK